MLSRQVLMDGEIHIIITTLNTSLSILYENIKANTKYPNILVLSGFNDARVSYWSELQKKIGQMSILTFYRSS